MLDSAGAAGDERHRPNRSLTTAWPPSLFAWKSLEAAATGNWLAGLGWVLASFALGLAASAAALFLLAGAWAKSLLAFGEGSLRKLASAESKAFVARGFSSGGTFRALFLRENRMMNREPMYFLNGPFIIVLMPLILVVVWFVQRGNMAEIAALLDKLRGGPLAFLACAAFGAFLGSATSIAATSLSRDAKALPAILALPVRLSDYLFAKLAHALVWGLAGALIGGLGLGFVVGLGAWGCLAAVFVAFAFSSLFNAVGLWIDTANPRLAWDDPVAAMKQNPNSLIVLLGAMTVIVACGFVAGLLPFAVPGFTLLFGCGSTVVRGKPFNPAAPTSPEAR